MDNRDNMIETNEIVNFKIFLPYVNSQLQKKINFFDGLEDPTIFFRFNFDSVEIKNSPFESEDNDIQKLYTCDFNEYECNQEKYVIKFNVKHFLFLLGEIKENDNLVLYMLKDKHKKLIMVKKSGLATVTCKLRLE